MLYRILRACISLLSIVLIRRHFVGRENFPKPPYILVSNHMSTFDAPVLLALCPHVVHAIIAIEQRKSLINRLLLEIAGTIWLRRGETDRGAMRRAFGVLKQGRVLGIAPEGTRSHDGALQRGKAGVAYIALRGGVPLIPVGLSGTEKISQALKRMRRRHVRAAVGKAFQLPPAKHARGQELQEYADLIMRHIAALLPEEYRGFYADEIGPDSVSTDSLSYLHSDGRR